MYRMEKMQRGAVNRNEEMEDDMMEPMMDMAPSPMPMPMPAFGGAGAVPEFAPVPPAAPAAPAGSHNKE